MVKEFKIYVLKRTKNPIFSLYFFYVDFSFNIQKRVLKFSVAVIGIIMEGTMSQILYLGPSFSFM